MGAIKSSIETMFESHFISYTVREGHQADVTASWTYKLDPGIWKLLVPSPVLCNVCSACLPSSQKLPQGSSSEIKMWLRLSRLGK